MVYSDRIEGSLFQYYFFSGFSWELSSYVELLLCVSAFEKKSDSSDCLVACPGETHFDVFCDLDKGTGSLGRVACKGTSGGVLSTVWHGWLTASIRLALESSSSLGNART